MDYINLAIRYGIMLALLIAAIWGVRYLSQFGGTAVAPADYRDMRDIPRYSTVRYDHTVPVSNYKIGDMVVISLGDKSATDTYYAWVGALPGDRIEIVDGAVIVNKKPINEIIDQRRQQKGSISPLRGALTAVPETIIPSHQFYLISDSHKYDSTVYGLFPQAAILGRVSSISVGE